MSTGAVQKKVKLDKIDRKILNDLQNNGRTTNVSLANNAGISAPPCLRRVRALEESKIIIGYHANLNAPKLGYGVTSFATVRLKNQGEADQLAFEKAIAKWDVVREAYGIAGDYDYMLRVVAKDWEDYQSFMSDKLLKISNVASVRSAMTMKTCKYTPGVPLDID
ncbi:MAG: ArsR family transcriptional regulator [Alphaproteobacteria bacterium]|nr:MAG: ArsR family transcriptional regulator [Alphaproteobacteria bacterium]